MNKYRYCTVQPKGMNTVYAYITDENILPDTLVEIPFGKNNKLKKGVVLDVNEYSVDEVPFPLENTRRISRIITSDEYDHEETRNDEDNFWADLFTEEEDLGMADDMIDREDYDAIFNWAYDHHDWVDSPKIMDKVRECYEICAGQNNPTAALNLGTLYYNGISVPQDYKKAAYYYEIAAAAGERRALCNLGYCWYYGRHAEVNYEKAYHYFNLCAQLYNDPNSLYKLGDMYQSGKAVEKNTQYAFRFYERALEAIHNENEDQFRKADILFRLGKALVSGEACTPDVFAGHDLLMLALSGFYERRKTDPFVKGLIESAKEEIAKAEEILDREII